MATMAAKKWRTVWCGKVLGLITHDTEGKILYPALSFVCCIGSCYRIMLVGAAEIKYFASSNNLIIFLLLLLSYIFNKHISNGISIDLAVRWHRQHLGRIKVDLYPGHSHAGSPCWLPLITEI